jgi:pyrroloquinoline quinone (PQQ) biosynthesis protein C
MVNSEILLERMARHESRSYVVGNHFLKRLRDEQFSLAQVSIIIGQYWHPISYFTVFLPKAIAVSPTIPLRTFISKILWQELGEGNSDLAHETLYIQTMVEAGMTQEAITQAPPLPATERLMAGYRGSTQKASSAIAWLYGTEVIDLPMVSSVGNAVKKASGKEKLPWVDIHVKQEPDHVDSVRNVLNLPFSDEEQDQILDEAQRMWLAWSDFYKDIEQQIDRLS